MASSANRPDIFQWPFGLTPPRVPGFSFGGQRLARVFVKIIMVEKPQQDEAAGSVGVSGSMMFFSIHENAVTPVDSDRPCGIVDDTFEMVMSV